MLGVLMLLWSVLILPFVIRIQAALGDDFLPTGCLYVRTIGLALRFDWKVVFTEKGLDIKLRYSGREQKEKSMRESGRLSPVAVRHILLNAALRKNLTGYIRKTQLQADIRIGVRDAATTALLCGLLNAVLGVLPDERMRITPDFRTETFCVEIKCIAAFRMGNLLASAAVYLRVLAKQHMRQKAGGIQHG